MVAIDTSVWIQFLRGKLKESILLLKLLDSSEVLLPIPVKIELLSGVKKGEVKSLLKTLDAIPTLYPTSSCWQKAQDMALLGAKKGYHFGMGDLLIASLANLSSASLWSLDSDFNKLEELGFVKLFSVTHT